MAEQLRACSGLAQDPDSVPAPLLGSSQVPGIPAAENPVPLLVSGYCTHRHVPTFGHTEYM